MASVENHLIERLPRADRLRLLAICEPVELVLAEVMFEPRQTTRHVWLPTEGFVSLITLIDRSPGLEVGMVGREGLLGAHLALGVTRAPLRALVQGPGTAWRIGAAHSRCSIAPGSRPRPAAATRPTGAPSPSCSTRDRHGAEAPGACATEQTAPRGPAMLPR